MQRMKHLCRFCGVAGARSSRQRMGVVCALPLARISSGTISEWFRPGAAPVCRIVARVLRSARVIALGVRAWCVRIQEAQLEALERFLEKRKSWSPSKWKGELRRAPTRYAGHAATGTSSRDSAPPRKKFIADTSISNARFISRWVSARSTKTGDWRASERWRDRLDSANGHAPAPRGLYQPGTASRTRSRSSRSPLLDAGKSFCCWPKPDICWLSLFVRL